VPSETVAQDAHSRERPVAALSASAATGTARRSFRTDIQALRALAVSLVVANHLWPERLPGGYVGVDVFFVISGFLITSHLGKELFATGRVRLGLFYARRARRLLPAAFLVLSVSLVGAWLWLPYTRWNANAQEIVASAFYVENWTLAAKAVDYSAMNSAASMVQHYWSLSVEEQFYLVWPLALVGMFAAAVRWGRPQRPVLLTGLAVITTASLGFSVYLTEASHSAAYFNTPVRVWEFGFGALLALAGNTPGFSSTLRNILALAGFGMVLGSAAVYDHATPFPGWTALVPATGTALVILAGGGGGRLWHDRLTGLAPVQFIGNISYSLYLWHWPLIVVAPFVLGSTLGTSSRLALGFTALVMAWMTKRWVEDRWVVRPRQAVKARRVLLAVAAGMATILLVGVALHLQVAPKAAAAAELARTDAAGPCFGPRAVGRPECGDPFARPILDPNMGPANQYWGWPSDCQEKEDTLSLDEPGGPAVCDFSGGRPGAETVWLVGDSHAQQWQPAIVELARKKQWKLKLSYSGGCPLADVTYVGYRGQAADPARTHSCRIWGLNVAAAVEHDKATRVFTSTFAAGEQIDDGTGRNQLDQYKDGFRRYWSRWTAAGAVVYPIADPPLNDKVRDVNCIAVKAADPGECRAPRDRALPIDPLSEAANAASDGDRVRLVDMSEYFCDASFCYGGAGGVVTYFDADHLNRQFTTQLAPYLDQRLSSNVGR